jgi:guanine deaminase
VSSPESDLGRATVVRAGLADVPRDPFEHENALRAFDDGALAFRDGRVVASGAFADVSRECPDADVRDERGAILLPGLVDTHVHFPQLAVVGAMGMELLDWLELRALPEEARMADLDYARGAAVSFVRALAAHGTTTALVFGSHLPGAQAILFEEAERAGLRIASGLAVSDRGLRPELELSPDEARAQSEELIAAWHGRGRLRYAVTPRFSVSCTEAMLEACADLLQATPGLLFTTHLNESAAEVELVGRLFPWARDYLDTYERYGLVGSGSVFAHDIHVTGSELDRLAHARAAVANCPHSNAFLGSGIFPLRRHLSHGVRVALGTDVGAGTGPGILKEALMSYEVQLLAPEPYRLDPTRLLYLATRAGACALGLEEEAGDLTPGRSADYVLIRPGPDSTLATVLEQSPTWEERLGALFALGGEDAVAEVRVAGDVVFQA